MNGGQETAAAAPVEQLLFRCLSHLRMFSEISSKPELFQRVTYSRKEQEDTAGWEERKLHIYKFIEENTTGSPSDGGDQQSQDQPERKKKIQRRSTVFITVLCIVALAGIIVLTTLWKWCPKQWTRFGSSCYFRSTEEYGWYDSRDYCQARGADLVIINSREEQEFVADLNRNGDSWIGLSVTWTGNTNTEWRWVDESPLTETFWETGWPENPSTLLAARCSDEGKWKHSYRTSVFNWICEK